MHKIIAVTLVAIGLGLFGLSQELDFVTWSGLGTSIFIYFAMYFFLERSRSAVLVMLMLENYTGPLKEEVAGVEIPLPFRLSDSLRAQLPAIMRRTGLVILLSFALEVYRFGVGEGLIYLLIGLSVWVGWRLFFVDDYLPTLDDRKPLYYINDDGRPEPLNDIAKIEQICVRYLSRNEFTRVYLRDKVSRDKLLASKLAMFAGQIKPYYVGQGEPEQWFVLGLASILLQARTLNRTTLHFRLHSMIIEARRMSQVRYQDRLLDLSLHHDAQGEKYLRQLLFSLADLRAETYLPGVAAFPHSSYLYLISFFVSFSLMILEGTYKVSLTTWDNRIGCAACGVSVSCCSSTPYFQGNDTKCQL
jgi:hypothetical protein